MKSSIRRLFFLLAMVVSFVSAQAAWAVVDVENPVTVEGKVVGINYTIGSGSIVVEAEVEVETIIYKGRSENSKSTTVITTTIENVDIYSMGPLYYWDDAGVVRPTVDNEVIILCYWETALIDGYLRTRLVAVEVTNLTTGQFIQLRDYETGAPLW